MGFAKFLDLTGRYQMYFVPLPGDVGIFGTVCAAWSHGGGQVRAWANQSVPDSDWAGAPSSGGCSPIGFGSPLIISFDAVYLKPVPDNPGDFYEIAQDFCVGTRVSFDVVTGPYAAGAQNLQLI
jgi:hypothetical protein